MYSLPIFAGSYLNLGILEEDIDEEAVNSETVGLQLRDDKLLEMLREELWPLQITDVPLIIGFEGLVQGVVMQMLNVVVVGGIELPV